MFFHPRRQWKQGDSLLSDHQDIIISVDSSIGQLMDGYRRHPFRFFTENDILMELGRILHQNLPLTRSNDIMGNLIDIVHTEYPTPFRCDMSGHRFVLKGEDDVTSKGGRFKRGHYDLLVLNPDLIERSSFNDVRGQDYSSFCRKVSGSLMESSPLALYGLELNFIRRSLRSMRGVENIVRLIKQDHMKLLATRSIPGLIAKIRSLVFFAPGSLEDPPCGTKELETIIKGCGGEDEELSVIFPA